MATYLQGVTDTPAQQRLYTPDYQFLTQVMGTAQAKYDRGFAAVKSMYNSAMNQRLTNQGNEQYRQEAFKKIEGHLKNLSGVDLGNMSNVMKANSLFDPIVKDQELVHDMTVTKHMQEQLSRADAIANSTDPEVRRTYSDLAKEDLTFVLEDLQNARRGDGSISQVRPREFVQFEDVNEFLNKQAKDAGLKIKSSKTSNGYILEMTNGKDAKIPFANWAAQQMRGRFDRQFEVEGRVIAERQIRQMTRSGMERNEALKLIAQKLQPELLEKTASQAVKVDAHLRDLNDEINAMKEGFEGRIPVEKMEEFQRKLQERRQYEEELKSHEEETAHLAKPESLEYIARNLHGQVARMRMNQTAAGWGESRAMATAELELRSDQTWISNMQRAMQERHHADDMKFKYTGMAEDRRKFEINTQLKMKELELQAQKNSLEKQKAKAKGELPSEEAIGAYAPVGQERTAGDVVMSQQKASRDEIFHWAFSSNGGLMEFVEKDKLHIYQPVVNKLKDIAEGGDVKLSAAEVKTLEQMAKAYNVEIKNPNTVAGANDAILGIASGAYHRVVNKIKKYPNEKKSSKTAPYLASLQKAAENFRRISESHHNLQVENVKITDQIYDPVTGRARKGYEKARVIGTDHRGLPVYDISELGVPEKTSLSKNLSSEFQNATRISGTSYVLNVLTPSLVANAFNPNAVKSVLFNGRDITASLQDGQVGDIAQELVGMPVNELQSVFGNSAIANFNPSDNSVELILRIGHDNKVTNKIKALKGKQGELRVRIPYEKVQSIPALNERLKDMIASNSIENSPLGLSVEFARNPNAVVKAPSYHQAAGFDYTLNAATSADRKPGVNATFTYYNPSLKREVTKTQFLPYNPRNRSELVQLENHIHTKVSEYLHMRKMVEDMHEPGETFFADDLDF